MELEEYRSYLRDVLSEKRFIHSCNVSQACAELAQHYSYPDVEKARFAGLVHDICKEEPKDVQYLLMMRSTLDVCEEERQAFKVWHGIAGAELLRTRFGVEDMDILRAVRFHTIGRAGMSDLEKIVYLGDLISAERSYPDVDTMRAECYKSLTHGMMYALLYSIQKQLRRRASIPHFTIEAYNETLMLMEKMTP